MSWSCTCSTRLPKLEMMKMMEIKASTISMLMRIRASLVRGRCLPEARGGEGPQAEVQEFHGIFQLLARIPGERGWVDLVQC